MKKHGNCKDDKDKANVQVNIRITRAQKDKWDIEAQKKGVSLAQLIIHRMNQN